MSVVELNGTSHRGRAVVQPYRHTFPSSGITVECRKVSPTALTAFVTAIKKECQAGQHPEHPYPEIPKVQVNVAGEMREQEVRGGELLETYLKDKQAWETWATQKAALRFLRMVAVDYMTFDAKEVTSEVAFLRRSLARDGAELPDLEMDMTGYTEAEIDRVYYLFCVCMLDQERESQALMSFLMGRSQPREEAIHDQIAAFRTAG